MQRARRRLSESIPRSSAFQQVVQFAQDPLPIPTEVQRFAGGKRSAQRTDRVQEHSAQVSLCKEALHNPVVLRTAAFGCQLSVLRPRGRRSPHSISGSKVSQADSVPVRTDVRANLVPMYASRVRLVRLFTRPNANRTLTHSLVQFVLPWHANCGPTPTTQERLQRTQD